MGQADQPDLLEAQIEADRAEIEEQSARYEQEAGWRVLAAVVGEPDLPLRPLAGNPEEGIPALEQEALVAALVRESPEIKAAEASVRRGQAAVERSRSGRFGDLFLRGGPSYNYDTSHGLGGWAAHVEVSFPLPLFNRAQGSVAAAQAETDIAQAEVRRVELALRARLASQFQGYARARDLVQRYRDSVIPKAERAHQLYLARFREMGAAYPQVLIAQRTVAQVKAEYLEALDDVWHHAILLQGFLLGGGLGAIPPRPGHEAEVMEAGPLSTGATATSRARPGAGRVGRDAGRQAGFPGARGARRAGRMAVGPEGRRPGPRRRLAGRAHAAPAQAALPHGGRRQGVRPRGRAREARVPARQGRGRLGLQRQHARARRSR